MNHDHKELTLDFPATSVEEWRKKVDVELKGAPFEKKMVTRTLEGIDIQPLYLEEDWPRGGDPSGFPGLFPYTRGTDLIERTRSGWDIRQEFREPNPADANAVIKTDLSRGVTSVLLRLTGSANGGGVAIEDVAGLEASLAGVDLAKVPVALDAGAAFLPAASALIALWRKRGVADKDAKGEFCADPLGFLAATGGLPYSLESGYAQLAALASLTSKTLPGVRAVTIDTAPYHNAGAAEVQDLGIALATAVAYLKALTAGGLSIDDACRQISFTLSVGCEEYLEIAKLRAARKLWAALATAAGASPEAAAMVLRAKSAARMFTRIDPWVNMLRATVSTFAAAVGGADSITCLPFDDAIGIPDPLGRRIARNTQVILAEESNLYRVADPAGGAWAIETLTQQMADKAWAFFQVIEGKGGIAAALASGFVQGEIAKTMDERDKAIAKRKAPLTGVSEFPNILESALERPTVDVSGILAEVAKRTAAGAKAAAAELQSLGKAVSTQAVDKALAAGAGFGDVVAAVSGSKVAVPALPKRRLADRFERLRDAAAAHKAKTGQEPTIFLANLGPIAKHTGRATFAKNFFEAGGIKATSNNGFSDVEACVAAFKESGAKIAIICSSDALYEQLVPSYAPALKAAGATTLYLAGAPGEKKADYDAAGVDDYIFLGGDVLSKLTDQLVRLGVLAK
ncbi:MAG TPA: methylmalonyl-CoA mutase family protein [Rhodopseudomonas sp.]|uniref:methylmalonyl-CoA mutase family protein n=1 Tax=Rhodopseudomonas sp. TaxID=1078 RepID=UPI002ED8DEE8